MEMDDIRCPAVAAAAAATSVFLYYATRCVTDGVGGGYNTMVMAMVMAMLMVVCSGSTKRNRICVKAPSSLIRCGSSNINIFHRHGFPTVHSGTQWYTTWYTKSFVASAGTGFWWWWWCDGGGGGGGWA
ncbi:hypothetical protein M0804_009597 [Polistes exclamans]|nr:hypothetical protein M0804_009597 [Polistes exclamans]